MSHIYIIYIYISVQCLSLGDPQRLKKPLKNGVLVTFLFELRVLRWRLGGFPIAQVDSRPFGLKARLLPSAQRQLVSAGETKAEVGTARLWYCVHRPCGIQAAAQSSAESPGQPSRSQAPNPGRGEDRTPGVPWASLSRALGSRFPRMSPTGGPCRTEQSWADQEGSIPSTQKDIMQISLSEIRLVWSWQPRMG